MNDKHQLLKTFCSVVGLQSFSKAADCLGLPVSSVSKQVKQLEAQLKTQLIIRNTRAMKLTDAGTVYYEKGRQLLKKMDELEEEIHEMADISAGKLRISLPLMLGECLLAPVISEFLAENSDVQLQLDFSHAPRDLLQQDFDLVFRTSSALPDSDLYEIKLLELRRIWVASPDYLRRHGTPERLEDLADHQQLVFQTDMNPSSSLKSANEITAKKIVSNSYRSLITAAIAGCGVACVYDTLVSRQLQDKTLVQLFRHIPEDKKYLSMLYRQRASTSRKIQQFVDYLKSQPVFR